MLSYFCDNNQAFIPDPIKGEHHIALVSTHADCNLLLKILFLRSDASKSNLKGRGGGL
eukprot:c11591_g2_i1 orf=279-452(+)